MLLKYTLIIYLPNKIIYLILKFLLIDNLNVSINWRTPAYINHDNFQIDQDRLLIKKLDQNSLGVYECIARMNQDEKKILYSIEKFNDTFIIGRTRSLNYKPAESLDIRLDFLTNFENLSDNEIIKIKCSSKSSKFI